MSNTPSALQQRFEREFDLERFRDQLKWLIEHRPVTKNGRLVKRTSKSIVTQIKAQHPGFDISEAHFSNLLSGKKLVVVSLQFAAYLCQVFGIESLDFFLDPDSERQRRMLLEPVETLRQQIAVYEALEHRAAAMDDGILVALRGVGPQDLATLAQLIRLRAQANEIQLLEELRALPATQRAAFEALIRDRAEEAGGDPSTKKPPPPKEPPI